jgi:hypothetical protein
MGPEVASRAVGVGSVLIIVKVVDGEEIPAMLKNVLHVSELSRRASWSYHRLFYDEYRPTTVHCSTWYMCSLLIPIRAFPSDGRTTWVRRNCNIHKGSYAYCTTSTSRYAHVRTVNLTSHMTRLSEVSDAE